MVDRKRNYKDRDNRVEWEERVVSVQRVTKVVKGVGAMVKRKGYKRKLFP